nr:hypothetical protein [Janthinobacterium sp. Marseille]
MNVLDDSELMLHRGRYSTIRAQHEDEMRSLQILCGQLSSTSALILRRVQKDDDSEPESVEGLIKLARSSIDLIEASVSQVESLAKQRADLKPLAWPK